MYQYFLGKGVNDATETPITKFESACEACVAILVIVGPFIAWVLGTAAASH